MKGMMKLLMVMMIPLLVVGLWNKYPAVQDSVRSVLDPTFGALLNFNLIFGFIIIVCILSFLQSLAQKYLTNQEELRRLKAEQKILQEEMKKYKDHPEKLLELQKKQFEFLPKTMDLTMSSVVYTAVPFVLLYYWFGEYLTPVWGKWWIAYYLIGSMIFGSVFRKILKIA